jgi:hypothetical protein
VGAKGMQSSGSTDTEDEETGEDGETYAIRYMTKFTDDKVTR